MTNITLRRVCVVLAVLLAASMLFNCTLSKENISLTQDRNKWEDAGRNLLKATAAVDSFIEKTMDTGEMDEFLESTEGQTYVKYTKK